MDYGHYTGSPLDIRDTKQSLQSNGNGELEKEVLLSDSSHGTLSKIEARTRVVRASDVLLSLAGRSAIVSDLREPSPAIKDFQEALRIFPPVRDDDRVVLGATEVKCPDCDAIFSCSNELKQHYLTKFCSGAAVTVYVMTRDRLITKGYRTEKRIIPFDSRPVHFFCTSCERQFSVGDDGETVGRQRDSISFVHCKYCGSRCNISYESILTNPRDDSGYRGLHKEIGGSITHSRNPSIAQLNSVATKYLSTTDISGEQSIKRKLRDSWSLRKLSQGDEDELIAISFAGLHDLERVHAPNGIYQQLPASTSPQLNLSDATFCSNAHDELPTMESEAADRTPGEDKIHVNRKSLAHSPGRTLRDPQTQDTPLHSSKRQSLLQKIFGKKVSKGVSRTQSTSNRGNRLLKRVNTVRFSFVAKYSGSERRATVRENQETSQGALAQETIEQSQNNNRPTTVQDAEYMTLLRGTQNIFVHLQSLPGGAIVHDASGRQRILQMDEVAKLFLQLKDELSAAAVWSRTLATRTKAERALEQGDINMAVGDFHDAIKLLDDTPILDIDKQYRAAILHSLGQAYQSLDMPVDSESYYLQALGFYKRTLGRDHPKNFAVLHDLGSLCERDGYATEAAALYERSFAGQLKTLGHNAPETLSSMQDLASLKVLLGDLESALLLLEKAVPALNTVFGIQNATTLTAMNQLSLIYQKLGLDEKSRIICGRAIPHCRTVFGINSTITRDAVVRYLRCCDNFDFPPDIKDILDYYQGSHDPDSLRVIHDLGRSYLDVGLNRDAANLFECLVEEFLVVKGPEAPETFEALGYLCVCREQLDSIDKTILTYKQFVHMAGRTPEGHHTRKKIPYAEKRISELNRRRELLASETKEWGLNEPSQCENCDAPTTALCNTCKLFRFCSESCHKLGTKSHLPYCIPSVSLRESRSLRVTPKCPSSTRDRALSKISGCDGRKMVNVTASYTFHLDPRNFTTFRMKLNPEVNTVVLFSLDSDIQYASIINYPEISTPPPKNLTRDPNRSTNTTLNHRPKTPSSKIKHDALKWLRPEQQEAICYAPNLPSDAAKTAIPPSEERYILITPGKEMLRSTIEKRIGVRGGGQEERFRALDLPDNELIEYSQGLHMTGYLGEVFMYVIEWAWK